MEEELAVEPFLVEKIIELLIDLVKMSPFSSQYNDVLRRLGTLLHSHHYNLIAQKVLLQLATKDMTLTTQIVIDVLMTLYVNSPVDIQRQVNQIVVDIIQRPDFSFEQFVQAAQSLYHNSERDSEERQFAILLLMTLVQRSDLSLEHSSRAALFLHDSSAFDS